MKKVASSIMAVAILFALNVNAQEIKKAPKAKAKAKTEKTSATAEKKAECGTEKKAGCCAHKS